jgi:chemotaxis response regulator CheB
MRIDMLAPELIWLEEQMFKESQVPLRILSQFHPLVRIPVIAFSTAELVATELAIRTIEAGGAGAIDLFTPEIRRYEDTALVGMGGMII